MPFLVIFFCYWFSVSIVLHIESTLTCYILLKKDTIFTLQSTILLIWVFCLKLFKQSFDKKFLSFYQLLTLFLITSMSRKRPSIDIFGFVSPNHLYITIPNICFCSFMYLENFLQNQTWVMIIIHIISLSQTFHL